MKLIPKFHITPLGYKLLTFVQGQKEYPIRRTGKILSNLCQPWLLPCLASHPCVWDPPAAIGILIMKQWMEIVLWTNVLWFASCPASQANKTHSSLVSTHLPTHWIYYNYNWTKIGSAKLYSRYLYSPIFFQLSIFFSPLV